MRNQQRRTAWIALAIAAGLTMSACGGSRVSPEEARDAYRAAAGVTDETGPVIDTPGATGPVGTGTTDTPGSTGNVPGSTGGTDVPAGGGGGGGGGVNAPTGANPKASCDGFKNQTGITDKEIVIDNISDLSGPVPGLFTSARDGVRAYVAYFNSTSDICGRKLKLNEYDSRTDAGADQIAYEKACVDAFAAVGSVSVLDSGGAGTAQRCGIPDLRGVSLSNERANCTVCYSAQASRTGDLSEGPYKELRRENRAATDSAAYLYLNTGGSVTLARAHSEVAKASGFNVKFIQSVETTDFNYGPYVQRLKSEKIRYVYFFGANPQAVRLVKAMESTGYKPDILQLAQTNFASEYVKNGGNAANGSLIWVPHRLFTQPNAEMALYLRWLQQVRPGADPTSFGVFAWSAARLFVEKSIALGGKLSRPALINAVRRTTDWTANGIHTAMDVGGKSTFKCAYFTRLNNGTWTQRPATPVCGKIIRTKYHE